MRMGQGVRTGLGHGGITCVLHTQFSRFFFWFYTVNALKLIKKLNNIYRPPGEETV